MKRFKKYLQYTKKSLRENFELSQFRIFRALMGGKWYKHESTGQLPGLYGSFWSTEDSTNRYTVVREKEDYT